MKTIAQLTSVVFHPIFYFTYLFVIYWQLYPFYNSGLRGNGELIMLGIIFFNTALLPSLIILLRRKGLFNQSLSDRRQTLFFTAMIYGMSVYFFNNRLLPEALILCLLVIALGLLIGIVINRRFKISLHASGVAGLVGFLVAFNQELGAYFYHVLILATLVAGMVGFSRLYLKAHTEKELYTGYALGFGWAYFGLSIGFYFI